MKQSQGTERKGSRLPLSCGPQASLRRCPSSIHLNNEKEPALQRSAQAEGRANAVALRYKPVWRIQGRPGPQEHSDIKQVTSGNVLGTGQIHAGPLFLLLPALLLSLASA